MSIRLDWVNFLNFCEPGETGKREPPSMGGSRRMYGLEWGGETYSSMAAL